MPTSHSPQPSPSRMVDFAGHPAVVGVVPGQPELVPLTAASLARSMGAPMLYFAYVDASRFVAEEYADGTVRHMAVDPDGVDDTWRDTENDLRAFLTDVLAGSDVRWELRYLAGRPDRSLTHLARAVDAAVIIVGTRAPGHGARMHEFLNGSVALQLSHHQHRPVLTVPLSVVDWKARTPWEE
ncbi:universal stress protein family protein [mine drainage metagenome]|uniref:Universal stress protein family protein n=1 Tax=mine drainage metagenome TaxID=410659 RepID=A0A1J5RJ91_9ZZZZ